MTAGSLITSTHPFPHWFLPKNETLAARVLQNVAEALPFIMNPPVVMCYFSCSQSSAVHRGYSFILNHRPPVHNLKETTVNKLICIHHKPAVCVCVLEFIGVILHSCEMKDLFLTWVWLRLPEQSQMVDVCSDYEIFRSTVLAAGWRPCCCYWSCFWCPFPISDFYGFQALKYSLSSSSTEKTSEVVKKLINKFLVFSAVWMKELVTEEYIIILWLVTWFQLLRWGFLFFLSWGKSGKVCSEKKEKIPISRCYMQWYLKNKPKRPDSICPSVL